MYRVYVGMFLLVFRTPNLHILLCIRSAEANLYKSAEPGVQRVDFVSRVFAHTKGFEMSDVLRIPFYIDGMTETFWINVHDFFLEI